MTDTLYALALTGIDNLEQGLNPKNVYDMDNIPDVMLSSSLADKKDAGEDFFSAVFRYRLTDGRIINRQYALRYSDTADALRDLLESREYRKCLFPVFEIDKDSVTSISLSDIYKTSDELKLDKEQKKALLNAYETDVLSVSADTFINGNPLGELQVNFTNTVLKENGTVTDEGMISYNTSGLLYFGDGTSYVPQLYIYPEYTNTLNLLKEYGYTIHTEIAPEDVASIILSPSAATVEDRRCDDLISRLSDTAVINYYDDSASEMAITVTARKDIELILSYMKHYAGGILDDGSEPDYMEVQYKSGYTCGYPLKI